MGHDSIDIEIAQRRDLEEVIRIYNASIPGRLATADLEPVSVMERSAWFDAHHPTRPLWVARRGQAAVGWLSFEEFYGRPAYHRTAEVSVYVAPEHQRRGIARQLLGAAINRAPEFGVSVLVGFIFGHNAASLKLFESFGFERAGALPAVAELDGVMRDLVIVLRRVPAVDDHRGAAAMTRRAGQSPGAEPPPPAAPR